MSGGLVELCASHGIDPTYIGFDGVERAVRDDTLAAFVTAFGISGPRPSPPGGIDEARAERTPPRCHLPADLRDARIWGLTCQLPSLASPRNIGMGDFADLASLCRLAAAEGADFVGLNPLHALYWSDPSRVSPFFPSNRRFLNPLYLALDWIDGFAGLSPENEQGAARLREPALIDVPAAARLKNRLLRRLFEQFPWDRRRSAAFRDFCAAGGSALRAHAVFEALSEIMVAEGHGAGWPDWPEPLRNRHGAEVEAFAAENRRRIDFHLWLQWLADEQLGRVQRDACAAGMRIGLYLDFAVGTAPDGSATWTDPELTVPGLSIGAPPDAFSADGQDWGLAPLSPLRLAELDCQPFAEAIAAVLNRAGAVRIDHAMGLARQWLVPRGGPASEGAYVRYPLPRLLARLAEASQAAGALVIGEDLGSVPPDFRNLMAERRLHGYKVLFFERDHAGFIDPGDWPADALACVATHDMPSFAAWWTGADLELRRKLGMLTGGAAPAEQSARDADRAALLRFLGGTCETAELSPRLHARVAASPCRLVALQIEDALGISGQVNLPGTIDEHPNWRQRLPVAVDRISRHPGFRAHVAALSGERPR